MTAISLLGIKPIRFGNVDREIDFHAFWRQCFNACNDWDLRSEYTAVAIMLQTFAVREKSDELNGQFSDEM